MGIRKIWLINIHDEHVFQPFRDANISVIFPICVSIIAFIYGVSTFAQWVFIKI